MKVQPPLTKEDYVYDVLREQILSGQLRPGAPLVLSELASKLSTSAGPVRQALHRLRTEQLVEYRPHHSAQVSRLSLRDLEEYLYIRLALEVAATRSAVPYLGDHALQKLRNLNENMREAIELKRLHQVGAFNKEFHQEMYRASPYQRLNQMIMDLWSNTDRHRAQSIFVIIPDLPMQSYRDHIAILNACERGDADLAGSLMDKHKRHAIEHFINKLKEDTTLAVEE